MKIPNNYSKFAAVPLIALLVENVSGAILSVDFGLDGGTPFVETGFSLMTVQSAPFAVSGPASGSLTVTFGNFGTRDRGGPLDNTSFTYGDLYRDLYTGLTEGATATTFSVSGLDPNTTYSMQIWSVDTANNNGALYSWYDTTGTRSNLLGTITNQTSAVPSTNNDFSILFNITSDATGLIELGHTDPAGTGTINGFVLDAVPEPGSLVLSVFGFALLLRRRR